MAESISSTDYDVVTGDDLFNSFMNVALSVEKETNCDKLIEDPQHQDCTLNYESTTQDYSECIVDNKLSNNTSEKESMYTRATNTQSSAPLHDVGLENASNKNTNASNKLNSTNDTSGYNDVQQLIDPTYDTPIEKYTPKPNNVITGLYAVPDKTAQFRQTYYADVTVSSSNVTTQPLHPTVGNYAQVVIKDPEPNSHKNQTEPNSHYEEINDYLKDDALNPSSVSATKSNRQLDPETIAYGTRYLSESQKQLYSSITSTIERGITPSQMSPRSASAGGKKMFFRFGKKQSSFNESTSSRTSSDSTDTHSLDFNDHDAANIQRPYNSICSGYMFKQGGTGLTPKNWRLRWFDLKKDNCLYYYKSEQDPVASGAVMLMNYSVTRAAEVNKRFAFKLVKGGARTYYFAVNSDDEMRKWMKSLGEAAKDDENATSVPECSLKNVSISALSIKEPDCHGWLYKQGNSHKSWKKRYCVLKYGCLFYYEDMSDECAIGVFKLQQYTITAKESTIRYGFKASPPFRKMRTYYFYSENEIDFKRWVEAMKHSVASFKSL